MVCRFEFVQEMVFSGTCVITLSPKLLLLCLLLQAAGVHNIVEVLMYSKLIHKDVTLIMSIGQGVIQHVL